MFQFRTRTYKGRSNYKNQYGSNLACLICGEEDDQIHLLQCKKTTVGVDLDGVQYCDIFSSIDKQVKIGKVLKKITSNREIIMKTSSTTGSQVHPCWCLICSIICIWLWINIYIATLGPIWKSQLSYISAGGWATKWYYNHKEPASHPPIQPSCDWLYLYNQWSDLTQILNLSKGDQTKMEYYS